MLYFHHAAPCYRLCGLWLFIAGLFLFVAGLPPFHAGFWNSYEPQLLAVFILSAANCLWLWTGIYKGWLAIHRPIHPLLAVLLAWIGWQLFVTLFLAQSSWRSWFGAPENCENAAWYLSVLLMALVASALWQEAHYRRRILWCAALAISVLCALHWFNPDISDPWIPNKWPDYIAFMIGYGWLALMANGAPRPRYHALLGALSIVALLIADNDSGKILLSYAIILNVVIEWVRQGGLPYFQAPGRLWRNLAMTACVLPMAWIPASLHPGWLGDNYSAMGSRAVLNDIGVTALINEPKRILTGHGWGGYVDDSFSYAIIRDVRHFKDGRSEPNAMNVLGGSYHSHNQPLEAMLALGLPGLLLWMLIPLIALYYMPSDMFWRLAPTLVAITIIQYVWFPLPQNLAYLALGWAVLCSYCKPTGGIRVTVPQTLSLACIPLAFLFAWSSWQQYQAIRYADDLWRATQTQPPSSYTQAMITDDLKRGGDRQWAISRAFLLHTVQRQMQADNRAVGWLRNLMRASRVMAQTPGIGANNASLEVLIHTMLMANITNPAFSVLDVESQSYFADSVITLARRAPYREDYAALYLFMLDKENDAVILPDLLKQLLAIHPDHRIALWLSGKALLHDNARAPEGRAMMRRAVALGVDRVYPLTDQDIAPFIH